MSGAQAGKPMTKEKSVGSTFEDLKSSARKIWLAGLGAISEAEKRGDEIFQNLVDKGEEYEDVLKEPVGKAGGAFRQSVETAKTKASSTLRELETVVERQVAAAMKRVGVASRDEVQSLRAEIQRLKKELESRKGTGRARSSTKKKASGRTRA
ncbi:MAG: phasin family protein [Vicinamibacteria bacterium]